MRFRFGEYEGRKSSSISNFSACSRTMSQRWYFALSSTTVLGFFEARLEFVFEKISLFLLFLFGASFARDMPGFPVLEPVQLQERLDLRKLAFYTCQFFDSFSGFRCGMRRSFPELFLKRFDICFKTGTSPATIEFLKAFDTASGAKPGTVQVYSANKYCFSSVLLATPLCAGPRPTGSAGIKKR